LLRDRMGDGAHVSGEILVGHERESPKFLASYASEDAGYPNPATARWLRIIGANHDVALMATVPPPGRLPRSQFE
jgi:hypothetical protein